MKLIVPTKAELVAVKNNFRSALAKAPTNIKVEPKK